MSDLYLPLYGEKRCKNCGFWRGQHVLSEYGEMADDANMLCPPATSFEPGDSSAIVQSWPAVTHVKVHACGCVTGYNDVPNGSDVTVRSCGQRGHDTPGVAPNACELAKRGA